MCLPLDFQMLTPIVNAGKFAINNDARYKSNDYRECAARDNKLKFVAREMPSYRILLTAISRFLLFESLSSFLFCCNL